MSENDDGMHMDGTEYFYRQNIIMYMDVGIVWTYNNNNTVEQMTVNQMKSIEQNRSRRYVII